MKEGLVRRCGLVAVGMVLALVGAPAREVSALPGPNGTVIWNLTLQSVDFPSPLFDVHGSLTFQPNGGYPEELTLSNSHGVTVHSQMLLSVDWEDGPHGSDDRFVADFAFANSDFNAIAGWPDPLGGAGPALVNLSLIDHDGVAFDGFALPAPIDPPSLALFEVATMIGSSTACLNCGSHDPVDAQVTSSYRIVAMPEPSGTALGAAVLCALFAFRRNEKRAPET